MTTKILIGGGELLKLFAAHPEVEIELTKQASMQVAEVFKRKVKPDAIVDTLIGELNKKIGTKWGFPPEVQEIIRAKAAEAVEKAIGNKASALVNVAVQEAVKRYAGSLEGGMAAKIDALILQKVTATFAAAAKLGGRK